MSCACLGTLQPGPRRVLRHGEHECHSIPFDGGEHVTITDTSYIGRCPRCQRVRDMVQRNGGHLCDGCAFGDPLAMGLT